MKRLIIILLVVQSQLAWAQRSTDTPKYLLPPGQDSLAATSAVVPPKSPLEILWEQQTVSGQNAVVEKATAGFFSTGKNAGIYAFHTVAPRGTVLKVRNLNNDRIIYVKVLGPMPVTTQFKGCNLGLSDAAKSALGARDSKTFCEISYMGY
jgi:hypothetical protein